MLLVAAAACGDEPIDFGRDIRPILSDKCFHCHGPDAETREADLRLDNEEGATEWAIVPGNIDESEVIARVLTDDPDSVMPPPSTNKKLTAEEVDLLKRWVEEGAVYQQHWAFVGPQRPDIPAVSKEHWIHNPIDAFVLRRLDKEALQPSDDADRITWLRRLSLDLIGLPPTIEEIDAFLLDESADADQNQIERLLLSPHFGERWARVWLDAARYADSDGYEKDKPRSVWFYRDWVVDAFNRDLPYDQFVIEQIAGDLIEENEQSKLVATGFLRNSMVNEEGGADPEQFRMEAMFDRMDAIGKSVLGLTIQCSQCHSHKYDPLTQHDYYRMFAFLNSTHDAIVPVYDNESSEQRARVLAEIDAIERQLKTDMPNWREEMARWEQESASQIGNWEVVEPFDLPFEGQKFRVLDDHSIVSESYAPTNSKPRFAAKTSTRGITGVRVELLTHPQLPLRGPGRSIRGTAALTEMKVHFRPTDGSEKEATAKIVSATADVNPLKRDQPDFLKKRDKAKDKRVTGGIDFAFDGDANTAWTTDNDPGRRNQDRKAVFVFDQPIDFEGGTTLVFNPEMSHGGWNSDDNHNCLMGRYRFSVTTDENPVADPVPASVREILKIAVDSRTESQQAAVFSIWRTTVDAWKDANERIEELWGQHPEGATQLVLEERSRKRETHLLNRGDFLSPVEAVSPGVPEFLHDLPESADDSRLTFARWLVDRRSPTTARSIVNRIWQSYFGIGLVETSDDLGSQSSPPSHPELLDWLAVELMENDWSLKHIHRLIVSSATYRQSSRVSESLQQRDPYNRLLARGPRFRVDAEIVRDITLAASGLLSDSIGGPPAYPPAPRFLFEPPASYGPKTWNEATGNDRYRRGLYTFRFRSVPYPMLETFDSVPGNVSCVRRNRSNTPLQALTSLNEPLAMECARALAARTLAQEGSSDGERLTFAMKCCVGRGPSEDELLTLTNLLEKQRQRIANKEIDPAEIAGDTNGEGESEASDRDKQAAWTIVCRVLLNLDETITKE